MNWNDYAFKQPSFENPSVARDLLEIREMSEDEKKTKAWLAFKGKHAREYAIARGQQEANYANFCWMAENITSQNRVAIIPVMRSFYGKKGFYISKDPGTGIFNFKSRASEALDVYELAEAA